MFKKKPPQVDENLTRAIDKAFVDLNCHTSEKDEYAKTVDQLTKLYSLKEDPSRSRVSKDTLALVSGNLIGILLIVGHERAHVVTSKALTFLGKLR